MSSQPLLVSSTGKKSHTFISLEKDISQPLKDCLKQINQNVLKGNVPELIFFSFFLPLKMSPITDFSNAIHVFVPKYIR